MFKKSLFVLLLGACGTAIAGSPGPYFQLGGSALNIEADPGALDADVFTLHGGLGYQFNQFFAAEGRIGFGIADDTVSANTTAGVQEVDVELNNYIGVYGKAGVPVGSFAWPYVAFGYTRGELEVSSPAGSFDDSDSDVSFGAGADFDLSAGSKLGLEYMRFYDEDGTTLDGFSLNYKSMF